MSKVNFVVNKYWKCIHCLVLQTDRIRTSHVQICFFLQQLLTHSETNVNLEGDLGNTPLILAASVDNHEALLILVTKSPRFLRLFMQVRVKHVGRFILHDSREMRTGSTDHIRKVVNMKCKLRQHKGINIFF